MKPDFSSEDIYQQIEQIRNSDDMQTTEARVVHALQAYTQANEEILQNAQRRLFEHLPRQKTDTTLRSLPFPDKHPVVRKRNRHQGRFSRSWVIAIASVILLSLVGSMVYIFHLASPSAPAGQGTPLITSNTQQQTITTYTQAKKTFSYLRSDDAIYKFDTITGEHAWQIHAPLEYMNTSDSGIPPRTSNIYPDAKLHVLNDTVYYLSQKQDGPLIVHMLDIKNGQESGIQTISLNSFNTVFTTIYSDEMLYVSAYKTNPAQGSLFAINLNQKKIVWSQPLPEIGFNLTVANQKVVVVTTHYLMSFDSQSGNSHWQSNAPDGNEFAMYAPTIDGNHLYTVIIGESLPYPSMISAYDLQGAFLWKSQSYINPSPANGAAPADDPGGSGMGGEGRNLTYTANQGIVFVSMYGVIYALNGNDNGKELWRSPAYKRAINQLVAVGDTLYVNLDYIKKNDNNIQFRFQAIHIHNGKEIWSEDINNSSQDCQIFGVVDNLLYSRGNESTDKQGNNLQIRDLTNNGRLHKTITLPDEKGSSIIEAFILSHE